MKLNKALLLPVIFLASLNAKAQTADQIIASHINAIGGKEVIEKIKSQVIEGELTVMGTTLDTKTSMVVGKGFRSVADFNGQEIIQAMTPTSGWIVNPLQGIMEPKPATEPEIKAAQYLLEFGGRLYNYKEKGSSVELVGTDSVDGVKTFKLKLTPKEGKPIFYFIDPSTYYVLKTETTADVNGQEAPSTSLFSDYKKTDIGYVMPHTIIQNQGFEMTVNVKKVSFNTPVDPQIFEIPKK
jgi:hypothetical protein